MKIKSSHNRWSYLPGPRIHGNVLAWSTPASNSKASRQVTETIMRWEDDGGPVSEPGMPLPQVADANVAGRMDTGPGTGRRMVNISGKGS